MAKDPRAILIITATRIGDAVLSSGLIKALHDQYPKARFTLVAGPVAAPLFADVPNLDRVIAFSKQKDGGHWFTLWRAVRGQNWDLVVDGRGSAISYFLMAKGASFTASQAGSSTRWWLQQGCLACKTTRRRPIFLHPSKPRQGPAP